MLLHHCTHWIFDMDGTLTLPVHDFDDIRRQLSLPENTPILEAIEQMPAEQASATKRQLHAIEMELAGQAEAQPGAAELLHCVRGNGCELGILTRNDEDIALATLQACGLLEFFRPEYVIGRETCAPKPEPDGVHYLLNAWKASPHATVMVGDFLYDIEAGRRGGVNTVHFDASGKFPWPELADHKVTQLQDIAALTRK